MKVPTLNWQHLLVALQLGPALALGLSLGNVPRCGCKSNNNGNGNGVSPSSSAIAGAGNGNGVSPSSSLSPSASAGAGVGNGNSNSVSNSVNPSGSTSASNGNSIGSSTSAASSASASSSSSASSGNSSGKRGAVIVPASASNGDAQRASGGKCSWYYNWDAKPASSPPSGVTHIPMLKTKDGMEGFAQLVRSSGAKTILGFNEPERADQANLSPGDAANYWKQYIEPLHNDGVRLGSPAVSAAPEGLPWLQNFIGACTGCTIDFITVHWYGLGADNFVTYLKGVNTEFPGYPIWVTEFASESSDETELSNFMRDTTKFMDDTQWVEGYSWFALARDVRDRGLYSNLVDQSGNPTTLGTAYF
ncbi:Glycoside hydrolase family 128 protein [Mycena kentingensis (nom. inval.)]|nr:Glycoside hydrolase family 128 protein [Mycena kentingensis (nom. inval.)]